MIRPDPVSGELTIENAHLNVEFRMINIFGQTVESGIVTSRRMVANMERYEKGNYLLRSVIAYVRSLSNSQSSEELTILTFSSE